ncbi:MAG TPA: DUF1648 domain-containing protein [Vicinamibacterales bacterium]
MTSQARLVRPTVLTKVAIVVSVGSIAWSLAFLLFRYPQLPDLLPVHFGPRGVDGWQFKTYWRVLLSVFIQLALAMTLGAIGVLLLSRPHGAHDQDAPDVRAAATAAEAVALLTAIWVVFQGYAGVALALVWQRGRATLGSGYTYLELLGIVLTIAVSVRAHVRLGRPEARPFIASHWRYGQLYNNREDPALFVPTRQGARWTLNFGRPVAAALLGIILALGIVCPAIILGLLLR